MKLLAQILSLLQQRLHKEYYQFKPRSLDMKKLTGILLLLIFVVANSHAKMTEQQRVSSAKQQYLVTLKSKNSELRHSAIYQIAQLKSRFPTTDFKDVRMALFNVAEKDKTPRNRLRALLTLVYIDDANLHHQVKAVDKDKARDYNEFYRELYDKMHSNLLYIYSEIAQVQSKDH